MKEGKSKDILEKTIDDLISYKQEHFRTEERMMDRSNYPESLEHKKIHGKLTAQVLDFQKKLKKIKLFSPWIS
jgi:hemerythrin-like metal-binding protein